MAAESGQVPVSRIREAVARSVERQSLREVARNVGMSPSGLRKFLDGAEPYSSTRHKLDRWYFAEGGGEITAKAAESALELLVQDLPPASRREALEQLIRVLIRIYADRDQAQPSWLSQLEKDSQEA